MRQSVQARYGVALLATFVALVLRAALSSTLEFRVPFVQFYPAIMVAGWYGGLGPGLLATLLGGIASAYFLLPPLGSMEIAHLPDILSLGLFVAVGVLMSLLNEAVRQSARKAEQHARDVALSEEKFRTTLQSIGDAVIVTDAECVVTFMNPVAETLTGWSLTEARGVPLQQVFRITNERTGEARDNPIERVLRDGVAQGLVNHTVLVARDGRRWPIDDSAAPIHDDRQSVIGAVIVFREILERRQRETERARLAAIVDFADDAVFTKTQDGLILTWNAAAERMYGYSAAEMIGKPVSVLTPPDRRAELEAILERLRRGERVNYFETKRIRKDGQTIDVSLTISPIRTADGRVDTFSTVARDVTERHCAEARVLESQERLRRVLESISESREALRQSDERLRLALAGAEAGVWEWSLASNEVVWVGVEPIHGLPPGAFGGTFDAYLNDVHPEDRTRVRAAIAHAVEDCLPLDVEYRIVRPDGSVRWVEGKGQAQIGPDGGAAKLAGVCMDITARKRAEQERDELLAREQVARARAEKADRLKEEFLSTVSHELRNPLNVVLGWSRLLASESLTPEQSTRAVSIIQQNAKAQLQLVDDLLDVSRFMTGKLRLDVQPLRLPSLIAQAIEAVRVAADAKEIRLTSLVSQSVPPVGADRDRLQQVFWNLLANAIKFTPRGGWVEVTVAAVGSNVEIQVRDSGRGIAPNVLPFIFERFRQGDASTTRSHGGLGLGLAVVRHVVEAHGGHVVAESAGEGQGATFTVTLPVLPGSVKASDARPTGAAERRGQMETAISSRLDNVRVLVVEDDPSGREFVAVVLQQRGAIVTAVTSVAEALQAFGEDEPHVIVTDIGMPGEDGFALIRWVRAREGESGPRTAIVALTGYAQPEDRERVIAAGCQRFLAKPIEPADLVDAVATLARSGSGLQPAR